MKVTFVLPRLDMTGGNRVVSVYARMLRDAGHGVVVVVGGPHKHGIRQRLMNLIKGAPDLREAAPPRSHFDGLGLDIRPMAFFRPATDRDLPDADVVIATWWETAEWVAALSASKGQKVYLVQGHEVFDGLPIDRVRATYRLPMKKFVVATWLRDLMRDEYGDDDVELMTNAFDPCQFYAAVRGKQTRPTLGLISSSAGLKAVHVAVRAIHEVRQSVPDLKVVAFGHELIQGLDSLGEDLEFHEHPSQERICECYSRIDVWLTSSRSEGFNLPALEAMACRTPVVSTRTGWPASAVLNGHNGFLAEVGDWHGLAEAATRVLRSDAKTWDALSEGAFQTARPLTWDQAYPKFEAALLHACKPNLPAGTQLAASA